MTETRAKRAKRPTWKDAKERLEAFDRQGLLELIQHLYNSDKGNQAFLHKRLDLGGDLLEPYKKTLDKCFPGGLNDPLVAQAKEAIASYKKVVGDAAGLAELAVYYCEAATYYANAAGDQKNQFLQCSLFDVRAGAQCN